MKQGTTQKAFVPVFKDQLTFLHSLWKAELAKMKKNLSWTKGQPRIDDIEHVHFFHTHDSMGRPQKYTQKVGGHMHEITVDEKTGSAKCGPPLSSQLKKLKSGKLKNVLGPISFYDEIQDREIPDNHTHDMTYQWSEKMKPKNNSSQFAQGVQAKTEEEKQALADI